MSIIIPGTKLAGAASHPIDQSIRFNDDDSPELTKTYSGAGSRTTQTFSVWFKLGNTQSSSGFNFYNGGTGTSDTTWSGISIYDHKIYLQGYSTNWKITTRVLRDHSAWYHLVYIWDTTNSVASERVRLYINGQRETDFSTDNNPGASASSGIGQAAKHSIGNQSRVVGYSYADAYMAEIVFIDGTAYGPENFGEENDNGIWVPKDVSGLTFGTNGFWIDGRDSGDLGDDESGRGNDYTASGLAAHDQVSDSPTNNFAVLNPVDTYSKLVGEIRNGNLELKDNSASVYVHGRATFGFDVTDSDGFYWESCDVVDGSGIGGICEDNAVIPSGSDVGFTGVRGYNSINTNNHYKLENTTYNSVDLGVASNAGDIVQFCVKNGKLFIGVNGTYVLSGNPATEANPLFTGLTGIFMPFGGLYSGYSYNTVYNFGQDGTFAGNKTAQGNTDANGYGNFFYAPPSGAKALCSKSLGS